MKMNLQEIAVRCSKFSGWKLGVSMTQKQIEFRDPNDETGQSTLILSWRSYGLYEVYGRMHHWGITAEERDLMWKLLSPE